jgi:hypothetical protein
MAEIQKASCHCSIEFLASRRCPVTWGARNPLKFAKVFEIAIIGPVKIIKSYFKTIICMI